MPQVGFEPTIPVFVLAKTVHASDPAATVIAKYGTIVLYILILTFLVSGRGDSDI
jgi:hypothetical protein